MTSKMKMPIVIFLLLPLLLGIDAIRMPVPRRLIDKEQLGIMEQFIYPSIDNNTNRLDDSLEDFLNSDELLDVVIVLRLGKQKDRILSLLNGIRSIAPRTRVLSKFEHVLNGIRVVVPGKFLMLLASMDEVFYIERSPIMKTQTIWERKQMMVNTIHNNYGTGDPNISIAILDTGISNSHVALAPYVIAEYDAGNTGSTDDSDGHGTACASIAAQRSHTAVYNERFIMTINEKLDASSTGSWYGYVATYNISRLLCDPNTPETYLRIIWKSDGGNSLTRVSLFYGNGENEEGWNEVAYVNTPNPNTDYWLNYNLASTSQLGRYHVCVYFNDNGGPPALVTMYVYFTGPGAPEENITGMAPGVKLVDVKVGEGNGLPYCLEGMEWVVAHRDDYNISVVSMSFGGRLSSLIDFAANNIVNNGIVAVVSAGNNGEGSHSKSPAAADNVITVAAVNINDKITEYSSQLAQAYATIKPDIAAPGGSWYTGYIIAAETNYDDIARNDGWPNDYTPFCGTSAAAPFVSGIAALIISALGGINYIKPWSKEKALKIKQLLLMTAAETNMPREITGQTVPLNYGEKDNIEGYGRINPLAAIELMKNTYNVGESRYFYLIPVSASSGYINALHNPVPPAPHVWASKVYLRRSTHSNDYYWFNISMNVASDVNIYLYEWDPDEYGQPILLAKTSGGGATSKAISFAPQRTGYYYVVVKADSGGDAYVTFRSSIVDNNPPEVQFLVTNSIIRKGVYCMNRSSEIYLFVEDISPTTVEFYVDQELKDFINGSTLRIDDGKHQLKWRVRDGKFTTERNVTIVMDNNPPQLKDLIVVSDLSSSKVHLYLEDLSGIKLIYYTTDDSLPDDIYNITQYWQACDFCVAGSFPEQVEAEITIEKKFEDKTLRVAVIDYCGNIRIVKIPIGKIDISPIIVIIGVAVAATVIVLVVNKKRNIIKIE